MTLNVDYRNFGRWKLFFSIYAKIIPIHISDSESQMPFSEFSRGEGGSVHRLYVRGCLGI